MSITTPVRESVALQQTALRRAIHAVREREVALRRVAQYIGDDWSWAICPGCRQSCTSVYAGQLCCVRCHLVVTPFFPRG